MDEILKKLTEIRYERNDIDFSRNKFRVRGDTLEIYPAYWSGVPSVLNSSVTRLTASAKSMRFPA